MSMIYVKPLKGRVIDPENRRPLPEKGKRVKASRYWSRRIAAGDAEIGAQPKAEAAPKQPPEPEPPAPEITDDDKPKKPRKRGEQE